MGIIPATVENFDGANGFNGLPNSGPGMYSHLFIPLGNVPAIQVGRLLSLARQEASPPPRNAALPWCHSGRVRPGRRQPADATVSGV